MKILHYSLGFPPYRTGGLTKFNYDLMIEQVKEGNDVALLWPGEIKLLDRKTKIKKDSPVCGIESYEVINPIPIPYDEGITDVTTFMDCGNKYVYSSFLKSLQPDVIHLHTLMGLHKNFLVAAKEQGIRLVFTTHDFFPICPKVTMFRSRGVCTTIDDCSYCPQCNLTALSSKKMRILQSPLYRDLKDSKVVKKLRKSQRDEYLSENIEVHGDTSTVVRDYRLLRQHYKSMLQLMDFIHYNSTLTKSVYDKYLGAFKGKVIPVTHGDILDHRIIKNFGHKTLCLTYLGPAGGAKGFFYLMTALNELSKEGHDFCLNVFFRNNNLPPYIKQHDRYNYNQLESIMNQSDIVITPSIWYETFGFTVLEALSYGVPVIVSDHVGAKDIIPEGGGFIFHSANDLKDDIRSLTQLKLQKMNKVIIKDFHFITEEKVCKEIFKYGYQA